MYSRNTVGLRLERHKGPKGQKRREQAERSGLARGRKSLAIRREVVGYTERSCRLYGEKLPAIRREIQKAGTFLKKCRTFLKKSRLFPEKSRHFQFRSVGPATSVRGAVNLRPCRRENPASGVTAIIPFADAIFRQLSHSVVSRLFRTCFAYVSHLFRNWPYNLRRNCETSAN